MVKGVDLRTRVRILLLKESSGDLIKSLAVSLSGFADTTGLLGEEAVSPNWIVMSLRR